MPGSSAGGRYGWGPRWSSFQPGPCILWGEQRDGPCWDVFRPGGSSSENLDPDITPLSTLGVIHAHRGARAGGAPADQTPARLFQQPEARAGLALRPFPCHQPPGGIQTVGMGLYAGLCASACLVLCTRAATAFPQGVWGLILSPPGSVSSSLPWPQRWGGIQLLLWLPWPVPPGLPSSLESQTAVG